MIAKVIKFEWQKLGKVFDPTIHQTSWMSEFAQGPATLELDDRLRVFFSCRPQADKSGQYVSYSSYLDVKKEDPTQVLALAERPFLSLGSKGCFDEFGTYPVSVIKHNDQYIAYYAGWTRCVGVPFNTAIGIATSSDATHFDRVGSGPVLGYSPEEPFVISGPKIRKFGDELFLFYIAGRSWKSHEGRFEPVYKIRMARSKDGIHWHRVGYDLIKSELEADEAQASPDVFYLNSRYHMLFCYRYSTDYRNHERGYRIGYAYSDDLLKWYRDDSVAGLDVSDVGWDSEMVSYPHVFESEGEIYIYYLGDQVGRYGFGAARLVMK